MLLQHPRQYTLSTVPNPLLCLGVLDILVDPCINVSNAYASTFPACGFVLDSFVLF
jgi:hypothetical protein